MVYNICRDVEIFMFVMYLRIYFRLYLSQTVSCPPPLGIKRGLLEEVAIELRARSNLCSEGSLSTSFSSRRSISTSRTSILYDGHLRNRGRFARVRPAGLVLIRIARNRRRFLLELRLGSKNPLQQKGRL